MKHTIMILLALVALFKLGMAALNGDIWAAAGCFGVVMLVIEFGKDATKPSTIDRIMGH